MSLQQNGLQAAASNLHLALMCVRGLHDLIASPLLSLLASPVPSVATGIQTLRLGTART